MVDTQAMTVRLPAPLYEMLREVAFQKRVSINALLASAAIWSVWNNLPDDEQSPVKRIARDLGMEPDDVAAIIFPEKNFGPWDDALEADLP